MTKKYNKEVQNSNDLVSKPALLEPERTTNEARNVSQPQEHDQSVEELGQIPRARLEEMLGEFGHLPEDPFTSDGYWQRKCNKIMTISSKRTLN